MSAAPDLARAAPAASPRALAAAGNGRAPAAAPAPPPALARRIAGQLGNAWLPRAAWTVERTGRPGLVGIALLLAAALFLFSTHLKVAADIEALRADLAAAQRRVRTGGGDQVADPGAALRGLPARTDMPAILRQLFGQAVKARLALDTGKYAVKEMKSSGVGRTQVVFPVTGPYPRVREFLDTTLATMPAVALSDLVLERKSIADGDVEAQIRLTVYTLATARARPPAPEPAPAATERKPPPPGLDARPAPDRVVPPTHAAALFAQHSWTVLRPVKLPPPAPVVAPPPPPDPTAPPFPYAFVGSFAPAGDPPVFFLARGDRVLDAHVGDTLDGVYQFESATGGQLVFVYLPLNIRQNIPAGASK